MRFFYMLPDVFWWESNRHYRADSFPAPFALPYIECPRHGAWGESLHAIAVSCSTDILTIRELQTHRGHGERGKPSKPVSPDRWQEIVGRLRKCEIPREVHMRPGNELIPIDEKSSAFVGRTVKIKSRNLPDILWDDSGFHCFVSPKFRALLYRYELHGATFGHVNILNKDPAQHSDIVDSQLAELCVCAAPLPANSMNTEKVLVAKDDTIVRGRSGSGVCEFCGTSCERPEIFSGYHVLDDDWNGDDLVRISPYPLYFVVSERMKRVLEQEVVRGCRFVDIWTPQDSLSPQIERVLGSPPMEKKGIKRLP